jgi:hypothetical protein
MIKERKMLIDYCSGGGGAIDRTNRITHYYEML